MCPRGLILAFVVIVGMLPWGSSSGRSVPPQPKRSVLIVDGMNNHDWERATRILKAILLDSGRFTVDVATSPPADAPSERWQAWKPDFARYDVVVMNFNGGHTAKGVHWPRDLEKSLEDYVSGGGGLVSYHAANNSFPELARLQPDDRPGLAGQGLRPVAGRGRGRQGGRGAQGPGPQPRPRPRARLRGHGPGRRPPDHQGDAQDLAAPARATDPRAARPGRGHDRPDLRLLEGHEARTR